MSFNDDCLDKLDEFRTKLMLLRPQSFKDELRGIVLTTEDIEQIFNEHRNPTTAQKMGEMLDMLKTKGVRGYKHFMKILGKVNGELFTEITGQSPPPLTLDDIEKASKAEFPSFSVPALEQLTIALKRLRSLEGELVKAKTINWRLSKEYKDLKDEFTICRRHYNVEKDRNKDRDRLEAERNDMMEQLTSVTGKALSYKEELDIANINLRELRLDHLGVKKDLEKAQRGLKQQRQKSLQIERTYSQSNSRIREELQEKVSKLEDELKKIDIRQNRKSLPLPNYAKTNDDSNLTNTPINQQLIQLQTDLEIMASDKNDAVEQADDATKRAYVVIQELQEAEEKLEIFSHERDDLLLRLEAHKDEAEMQKRFVMLAEHQLSRAVDERNQALSDKNLQTEKCVRLMLQRDKLLQDQRSLRAEMTTIVEKLTTSNDKLVKYKRRYRNTSSTKPHKTDVEEYTSSSSDDLDNTGSYDPQKEMAQQQQKQQQEEEENDEVSEASDKRSSNVTDSTNSSSRASLAPMQDSDEDLLPQPRARSDAYSKDRGGRRPSREQMVSYFPMNAFPDGASTDEDGSTSCNWYERKWKIQTDSTKVNVHHEQFRFRDPLLYESMNGHAFRRAKKKDWKPTNGLNRRSKSFNDLSNLSLEDDVDLDLELGLALQDQGSRYSRFIGNPYRGENSTIET